MAVASEGRNASLEAESHALVDLTSTGHVGLDTLFPLREIPLAGLPPQLQDYVSDLPEG
ncbi:hypothetical protein [Streptomyces sp. NPDC003401]